MLVSILTCRGLLFFIQEQEPFPFIIKVTFKGYCAFLSVLNGFLWDITDITLSTLSPTSILQPSGCSKCLNSSINLQICGGSLCSLGDYWISNKINWISFLLNAPSTCLSLNKDLPILTPRIIQKKKGEKNPMNLEGMASQYCLFSLPHTLSRTQKKPIPEEKAFPSCAKKLPARDPITGGSAAYLSLMVRKSPLAEQCPMDLGLQNS